MEKYTEIPTHLLHQAFNLLAPLGYQFEQAEFSGDLNTTIREDMMFRLQPLIKWLDYFDATSQFKDAA